MILDPIRPYFLLIKVAIAVSLICFSFVKGCSHGKDVQKKEDAKEIDRKNLALQRATNSLNAAGKILNTVNAEAKRRIQQDTESKKAAAEAGQVAATAEKKLIESEKKFKQDLKKARLNPSCDALLNMDLVKTCGL